MDATSQSVFKDSDLKLFEEDNLMLFEGRFGKDSLCDFIPEFKFKENYTRKKFPYLSAAVYYRSHKILEYLLKYSNIYSVDSSGIYYFIIVLLFIVLVSLDM